MNKQGIEEKINEKISQGKMAFIPFIVAGDPNIEQSGNIILALQEAGADIIEIGIPYSDPLADGPIIQKASKRAIDSGSSLKEVIKLHNNLKDKLNVPTIVFTYYNPVLAYGLKNFVADIKSAGFKGVLVPDLPVEEAGELLELVRKNNLELIMLVTPTSGDERIKQIVDTSEGFVYLVSVTGVTGVRDNFSIHINHSIGKIKSFTSKPICVGFGISSVEHIKDLKRLGVQGAIVGSALIKIIETNINDSLKLVEKIKSFVKDLISYC